MTKIEFIEELEEIIAFSIQTRGEGLSPEASKYFEAFKAIEENEKPVFTESGAKILQWMRDNKDSYNNIFKAKDICEGLFLSSTRIVSGAMRKLVADNYVSKTAGNPVCYSITDDGMTCEIKYEPKEEKD